jgi:hypothetical protein
MQGKVDDVDTNIMLIIFMIPHAAAGPVYIVSVRTGVPGRTHQKFILGLAISGCTQE